MLKRIFLSHLTDLRLEYYFGLNKKHKLLPSVLAIVLVIYANSSYAALITYNGYGTVRPYVADELGGASLGSSIIGQTFVSLQICDVLYDSDGNPVDTSVEIPSEDIYYPIVQWAVTSSNESIYSGSGKSGLIFFYKPSPEMYPDVIFPDYFGLSGSSDGFRYSQPFAPMLYNEDLSSWPDDGTLSPVIYLGSLDCFSPSSNWYPDYGITDIYLTALPTTPVPEPTTMLLISSGLVVLAGFRKKFKK